MTDRAKTLVDMFMRERGRVDPQRFAEQMAAQQRRRVLWLAGLVVSSALDAALDDHDPGDEDRT